MFCRLHSQPNMAENMNSKRTSAAVGHRDGASAKAMSRSHQNLNSNSRTDILSKEEEYKRLNAELEARTASLVQEAEQVMRGQEAILAKSRLLDNINTDDFLKEFDDSLTEKNEDASSRPPSRPPSKSSTTAAAPLKSGKKRVPAGRTKPRSTSKASAVDDVATVQDETFMTEFKEAFTYHDAFAEIEDKVDKGNVHVDEDDDVLPQVAQDMGTDATIRFLKAKVRVMQEELDRLAQEYIKKEEEQNILNGKLKELEDERGRLHRTNMAQQTQMDKYKKLAEDTRTKSESQETQLTALRKELEQLKRNQKQQLTSQSATEVRLNRALEEIEKYKEQLQKTKVTSKDSAESEKKRVDQLLAENKRLEKQKNELMAGFKKQMKLIDILKRQKMHIEAAKMLQFSEEEFVKALEWGS